MAPKKDVGKQKDESSPSKQFGALDKYVVDLTSSPVPSRATEQFATPNAKKRKAEDFDDHDTGPSSSSPVQSKSSSKKAKKDEDVEKRLKVFRKHAPQSFLQKLERAQLQKMVVINRERTGSGKDLKEAIDIVGSTGNIYTVTVSLIPSCTCPDHKKGNECKHKVYALNTVLRAPYEYQYQRALLTNELAYIFEHAPPIPHADQDEEDHDGKRKPLDGECPICYMEFDEENNEITWCKAGCGNNMHKDCFDKWAASQRGQEVRCVYCRTSWQRDNSNVEEIKAAGEVTDDGYVNVADQFGISKVRDTRGYYQPWARRNFGYGG